MQKAKATNRLGFDWWFRWLFSDHAARRGMRRFFKLSEYGVLIEH